MFLDTETHEIQFRRRKWRNINFQFWGNFLIELWCWEHVVKNWGAIQEEVAEWDVGGTMHKGSYGVKIWQHDFSRRVIILSVYEFTIVSWRSEILIFLSEVDSSNNNFVGWVRCSGCCWTFIVDRRNKNSVSFSVVWLQIRLQTYKKIITWEFYTGSV